MDRVKEEATVNSLREELSAMKQMFSQLSAEKKEESFDARRSFALKCQIFQLERQCMLMQQSLSRRATSVSNSESQIVRLTQYFQTLLASGTGPTVSVARADVVDHIQSLHKMRASLRKHTDLSHGGDGVFHVPVVPVSKFSKSPLTCVDVCNSTAAINLNNVARLEEDLSSLRGKLVELQTSISAVSGGDFPEKYLCSGHFKRLNSLSGQCREQLEECCDDLTSLSLLHPNAPWKITQDPNSFGVFDPARIRKTVFSGTGQLSKSKAAITSMCKAHSYLMNINKKEVSVMRREIDHCRHLTHEQVQFTNSLLDSVRSAYERCRRDLNEAVVAPMRHIHDAWLRMKERQSDASMSHFLSVFAQNEEHLARLLPADDDDEEGSVVLNEFGEKFANDIRRLQRKCTKDQRESANEIKSYRDHHESDLLDAMRTLHF